MERTELFSDFVTTWKKMSSSKRWFFFLCSLYFIPQFGDVFEAIEKRIGLSFMVEYSDTLLILLAVACSIPILFKQVKAVDVLFIGIVALWHPISAALFPETSVVSAENAYFFYNAIFVYFVGRAAGVQITPNMFVVLAYLELIVEILFLFAFGLGTDVYGNERTRMMTRAYSLLPFILFLLWYAFEKGGIFNYAISLLGVFVLFAMGTRGPIICLVFYIIVYLLLFKRFKYNTIVKSLLAVSGVIFYFYLTPVLLGASTITQSLGLSTRVFDSILDNQMVDIKESSGRDVLFNRVMNYLSDKGAYFNAEYYADRIATGTGEYAHNLEGELMCDFGFIGGALLIIALFIFIYKSFRKCWNTKGTVVLFVFFCTSIMGLQFSSSFLTDKYFWFFLGLCAAMITSNRFNKPLLKG